MSGVNDQPDAQVTVDTPLTLTALAALAGLSQPQLSRLAEAGAIYAPVASRGRARAVPVPEVRRVLLVVQVARKLDIAAVVLFRALADGRAALLPDGRIALGPTSTNAGAEQLALSTEGGQLVA